jgi:hypothetical protein
MLDVDKLRKQFPDVSPTEILRQYDRDIFRAPVPPDPSNPADQPKYPDDLFDQKPEQKKNRKSA